MGVEVFADDKKSQASRPQAQGQRTEPNPFSTQNHDRVSTASSYASTSSVQSAVTNYVQNGGDLGAYLKDNGGHIYVLVPISGSVAETSGPRVSDIHGRNLDFSGSSGKQGAIELLGSVQNEVNNGAIMAGTATAYGFNGMVQDVIGKFPEGKVREVYDGQGNKVEGAVQFDYMHGQDLIDVVKGLIALKDEKNMWGVGSTPDLSARENTLRSMLVPVCEPSLPKANPAEFIKSANISPTSPLSGSFINIDASSSYMFIHNETGFLPFSGKSADGTPMDYVLVKDQSGILTLYEKGGVYREQTDGTYNDNSADGKGSFKNKSRVAEKDESLRAADQLLFMEVFGIQPMITVKRAEANQAEVDPSFDNRLKSFEALGTVNFGESYEANFTSTITCNADRSKAMLVSQSEYYGYIVKQAGNMEGVSTSGNMVSVSGKGELKATYEAFVPIDVQLNPKEALVVLDWSGSTGFGQCKKIAEDLSQVFKVSYLLPSFDGTNDYRGTIARNMSHATLDKLERNFLAQVSDPKDIEAVLASLEKASSLKAPVAIGECKPDANSVKSIFNELGIDLSKDELSRIIGLKDSKSGVPLFIDKPTDMRSGVGSCYSVSYNSSSKTLEFAEVSVASTLIASKTRYDIVAESDGTYSLYNRGRDFDNYSSVVTATSGLKDTNVYVIGDWGNRKIQTGPDFASELVNNKVSISTLSYGSSLDNSVWARGISKETGGTYVRVSKSSNAEQEMVNTFLQQYISDALSRSSINTYYELPMDLTKNDGTGKKSGTVSITNPLL